MLVLDTLEWVVRGDEPPCPSPSSTTCLGLWPLPPPLPLPLPVAGPLPVVLPLLLLLLLLLVPLPLLGPGTGCGPLSLPPASPVPLTVRPLPMAWCTPGLLLGGPGTHRMCSGRIPWGSALGSGSHYRGGSWRVSREALGCTPPCVPSSPDGAWPLQH